MALENGWKENSLHYREQDPRWVENFLDEKGIKDKFIDTSISFPEIKLKEGGPEADAENAVRLHEAFRKSGLSRYLANDKRLWIYMTHVQFYDYMRVRWEKGTIGDRYFTVRKIRNGIARLYLTAELSFDEDAASDPYLYTRTLFEYQDLVEQVIGRSVMQNPKLLRAAINSIKSGKSQDNNEAVNRVFFEDLFKLSGVCILDALDTNQLIGLCDDEYDAALNTKFIPQNGNILLRDDDGKTKSMGVKGGILYIGKAQFRNVKPKNLARVAIGKRIDLDGVPYTFIGVQSPVRS